MFLQLLLVIAAILTQFLPSPQDKDGLGLRIHLERDGPFLERESINSVRVAVTLINFSKKAREHDPFIVALDIGDLDLHIAGPDGKPLASGKSPNVPRDPFTVKNKLQPGDFFSDTFYVASFGSRSIYATGRYQIEATIAVDGKTIPSPPLDFEVIKVPDEAVLVSRNITLAGPELALPAEQRQQATVQQLKVGSAVWLVYRRFAKGGVFFARRIAVLPGKVEMTVNGSYGDWGPIRVAYKTSLTAAATTIAVHSVDGMPWAEANERNWLERQKLKKDVRPPAPQPVQP
jgi:hypothetical protein